MFDFQQYQVKTEAPSGAFPPIQQFESTWHQPWSEPVRQKIAPVLAIALITSGLFAPVLNPDTQITRSFESKWHQGWSEPVRIKPQVRTGDQPFFFFEPEPPIYIAMPWFDWLSEPVRLKPGLGSWLQHSLEYDPWVIPTSTLSLEGYQHWWSTPVWPKRGLSVYLQQTLAQEPRLLRPANVTLTMSVKEINTDSALFGIVLYNNAVKASVSIKEIAATKGGAASIEET